MAETPLYDAFSADYDRFVDWDGRLAHDLPFLLREFQDTGAQSVLDMACGTGWHAIALAREGYAVVGADVSAGMINRARENAHGADAPVCFVQAGFGGLADHLAGTFDGLMCMGNSLPHIPGRQALRETLADFAAVLRPGGVLIVQQRNFDQVWNQRQRFMPLQTYREGDREWLFFRFYDFGEETITFNMVTLLRRESTWSYEVEATELWPIFQADLVGLLGEVGFEQTRCYGNLRHAPFVPEESGNLVVVARKSTRDGEDQGDPR